MPPAFPFPRIQAPARPHVCTYACADHDCEFVVGPAPEPQAPAKAEDPGREARLHCPCSYHTSLREPRAFGWCGCHSVETETHVKYVPCDEHAPKVRQ